jgi:hypothetical protein
MPRVKLRYLIWAVIVTYLIRSSIHYLAAPSFLGMRSVRSVADLYVIVSTRLFTINSSTVNDVRQFADSHSLDCEETYNRGHRQPNPNYLSGAVYGVSCQLPYLWIEEDGLMNLLVPTSFSVTFYFDQQNTLVVVGVADKEYFR